MNCECGSGSMTTDTRKIDLGVWRRRECKTCGAVFTTLEQKCVTTANPYPNKGNHAGAQGKVVAPPVPAAIQRPNPPKNRSKAPRKAGRMDKEWPGLVPLPNVPARRAPSPDGKFSPAPAAFAPPKKESHWTVPSHAAPPVDRVTETARDRIEDMKAEREQNRHGWDK